MSEPIRQRKARPGELTHVSDPKNVQLVVVEDNDEEGMSVEDAYRHLAGMPPEPVIEPEEG